MGGCKTHLSLHHLGGHRTPREPIGDCHLPWRPVARRRHKANLCFAAGGDRWADITLLLPGWVRGAAAPRCQILAGLVKEIKRWRD